MTDPGSVCPANWTLHTFPVRGCWQTLTASYMCHSAFYFASGKSYSRVSGRILAYQVGFTSIDSANVDGVLVTRGPAGSRQHIGTFAAALYDEDPNYNSYYNCPCTDTRYSRPYHLRSFIKNNHFCDTTAANSFPTHVVIFK